jgi:signal transduction histidine kinase
MLRFLFTGFAATALVAAGILAANDLRHAVNERDQIIDNQARAFVEAERLRNLDELRTRTSRSLLLTGDKRFSNEWRAASADFYDLLGRLRKAAITDESGQSILARVEDEARMNDQLVEPFLQRRLSGGDPETLGPEFEAQIQPQRDALEDAIDDFVTQEEARFKSSRGRLIPTEQSALVFISAITVAAVLLSIVAAWTARRATMSAKAAALSQARAESELAQRTEAEALLETRTLALERSNADLERFAYVASHDLQEPLRTVAGFTELLGRRYKGRLDKDADEFIAFAVEGVAQMQRLISDLLAFSRVTTRAHPRAPTDSGRALDRAISALRASIEESHARITRSEMPQVMANETQLSQVFQNLLSNAIKFERGESPQIQVSVESRGDEWEFAVSDNGIGIEPQYFERIFVLFQRLHERERYEGTGLGLAIAKKVIELHGGRMWVESRQGLGSTFRFTLHAAERGSEKAVTPNHDELNAYARN